MKNLAAEEAGQAYNAVMRCALASAMAFCAVLATTTWAPSAQQSDAASLIAAARKALGGEAALAAVSTLTIGGSLSIPVVPGLTSNFETSWVSPDRFLRIGRRQRNGVPTETIDYDGFVGDQPIKEMVAPNVRQSGRAEALAANRQRILSTMQTLMLETLAPLFIALPSEYGIEMRAGAKATVGRVTADVIEMRRADGKSWRLWLDEKTHLPVQMTWRAKPVIMASVTSSSTFSSTTTDRATGSVTSRGGAGGATGELPGSILTVGNPPVGPPNSPPGNPSAAMPDVDWVMTIGDYRKSDGLNWPRRFKKTFGGEPWEDIRVSRYRINPKIDPAIFERQQ